MAKEREPNVRSRQLGDRLLRLMVANHYGIRDMARRLDMSAQWVSHVTRGLTRPDPIDIARFLTVLGVIGEEYAELMALSDDVRKSGLLEKYGDRLPVQVQTLVWHEERASAIAGFQGVILPGLLQTASYARALIVETGSVPNADEVDERVFARLSRQVILTKRPQVEFRFFIHEFALRLPIGREQAGIMSGQLAQLANTADRPNVVIRVVPAACGGHAALSGHFQLIESSEFKPVVYIDSEVSSLFLEEPVEVGAYRRVLKGLDDVALDEAQSRYFITGLAEGAGQNADLA
jgi:transcriptional regulator with XRE-family HTH domain